jgi:hypothetical protein
MQAIIVRWCDLIGVTNEGSIQVATGAHLRETLGLQSADGVRPSGKKPG